MSPNSSRLSEGFLFTDFYQLTMAQLYFKTGIHNQKVQFEYFFRRYPDYGGHQAGYAVFAGLATLLDWMERTSCSDEDIEALRVQRGSAGKALFAEDFLTWLREAGNFRALSIRSVAEGRVVHPNVPLAVVRGPLAMAQLLETALLNHLNYQTLIATKASRIAEAAGDQPVIDFGMRRGHGKAVNEAARAALIGGAQFSSNTGASCVLGYPPKGTHGHSMVQAFMARGKSELDAFRAYAQLYPDDCVLLVDTVNTLESGIPHAIEVFEELKRQGHAPHGIRLDSGDLAYLSLQAHKMLNAAGFPEARIVLSNQLDEVVIAAISRQIRSEAADEGVDADALLGRLVYGVGTSLVTSMGCSAIDGVYKLTAITEDVRWVPAVKLSESRTKITNPGAKHVWRIYDQRDKAVGDLLTLDEEDLAEGDLVLRHPVEAGTRRIMIRNGIRKIEPLLETVFDEGRCVPGADIEEMRRRRRQDLEHLDAGVKRLVNPHLYHVSLSEPLWDLKQELIRRYGAADAVRKMA